MRVFYQIIFSFFFLNLLFSIYRHVVKTKHLFKKDLLKLINFYK